MFFVIPLPPYFLECCWQLERESEREIGDLTWMIDAVKISNVLFVSSGTNRPCKLLGFSDITHLCVTETQLFHLFI